ncbi:MAG: hypothetical protein EAZ95_06815 [Bacteroidetes bacterium]|nr:MAG: hypothetical protein EAZ95_06815 [Bacteroidota bacterium]
MIVKYYIFFLFLQNLSKEKIQIKKYIGNYEVYDSGTVIGIEGEPIMFAIDPKNFIVKMIFNDDLLSNEHSMNVSKVGTNTLLLSFTNYNHIGVGNQQPIRLGTVQNRELLLLYRVYSLNKGGKTVHYTWLLGEEVKNGR